MASSSPFSPDYYPPVNFHFDVRFGAARNPDGNGSDNSLTSERVAFQSVSGLTVQIQTENIKEGGENRFEHTIPSRTKYGDLVLKRGLVYENSNILKWLKNAFENQIFKPVDMQILMLNEAHDPLVSWDILHAWPKNWKFDEFNAEQGKVFIETLELNYNSFRMSKAN